MSVQEIRAAIKTSAILIGFFLRNPSAKVDSYTAWLTSQVFCIFLSLLLCVKLC